MKDSRLLGKPDHEDLICPLCGRSLLPVPLGDSFTMHCKNGHELKLSDLLAAQTESLRHGLGMLLADWEVQLAKLHRIAADARRNGYLEVAEIVYRQTRSLACRIELLRQCLPQNPTDTSRTMRAVSSEGADAAPIG